MPSTITTTPYDYLFLQAGSVSRSLKMSLIWPRRSGLKNHKASVVPAFSPNVYVLRTYTRGGSGVMPTITITIYGIVECIWMKKCDWIYVKSLQYISVREGRMEAVFVSTERSSRALDADDESDDL